MAAFRKQAVPERSDSEADTATSDEDDDDDDSSDASPPQAAPRAAAAHAAHDDDDDDSEDEDEDESDASADEDEEEDSTGSEDAEALSGEEGALVASRGVAGAPASARPPTPGDVSTELVELALEVVDGDDVSPVVRLAFERSAPQGVVDALEVIIERKVGEAQDLVAQHYEEFVTAMAQLRHVQEDAEDLTAAVRAHNEELQAAGRPLLELLQALERQRVQAERLAAAGSAAEACLAALTLCRRVVDSVDAGQYYAALRLLDRVRAERLPGLPCGALRDYCMRQLPLAEALVEERAKALLDAWLADAAAAARGIGRRAVAAAASSRAALQARWDAQLAGVRACAAAGALDVPPAFALRGASAEEDEEPLEGLSLTRVATARHALACLGKEDAFWAHFAQRRAQQLGDALTALGEPFLESYQGFFGAVVGFFVVEGHVARAAGGAITPGQLAASWDRAAGALANVLAAQLARIPSAGELLLVADYVRLLTASLQAQGLWTAALDAALHDAQERYHALAADELLASLGRAMVRDTAASLQPAQLNSRAEYEADVSALGLHPPGQELPAADDFPLLAPFTPLVPAMLRLLRAHTVDSCAFCGAAGEEGVRTVSRYRDALLQRAVDELLAPQLRAPPRAPVGTAATPLVQLAANAAALDGAAAAQDSQLAAVCHVAEERAASLALAALAAEGAVAAPKRVLRAFRERAEEALLAGLCAQVDAFFAGAPLEDWLLEAPRTTPREAAHASAAFLQHALGEAAEGLAPATCARLCRAALGHASDALLAPLLREDGRRFNVHALAGLAADVAALTSMTSELGDAVADATDGALAEPRQLCALFAGDALEQLAGPACEAPAAFRAALQRSFFALAPARLALLLDRYREPPGPGLLHRGAAPPAVLAPKRKTVGVVLDRVRALMRPK